MAPRSSRLPWSKVYQDLYLEKSLGLNPGPILSQKIPIHQITRNIHKIQDKNHWQLSSQNIFQNGGLHMLAANSFQEQLSQSQQLSQEQTGGQAAKQTHELCGLTDDASICFTNELRRKTDDEV